MISLIICEYRRPEPVKLLLTSVMNQTLQPDEILIIDGSPDLLTKEMLEREKFPLPIKYLLVDAKDRGLTKQRNIGAKLVHKDCTIVCYLDNDTVVDKDYFFQIKKTFDENQDIIGMNGYITDEKVWELYKEEIHNNKHWYILDGYVNKLSERHYMRRLLGLFSDVPTGYVPTFSHGYDYFPPSGKTYQVEHLIGCCFSFKKSIFEKLSFSEYFEGYGLYEDFDFSVRATKYGNLYLNTNAKLEHHHHPSGRPDTYLYGKMVTEYGWYVWRLRHPKPPLKSIIKWYIISLLLAFILLKSITKKKFRREFLGRIAGIIKVIFAPPKINY